MDKIIKTINDTTYFRRYFAFFLVVLVTIFLYLPSFGFHFSLLDDGMTLTVCSNGGQSLSNRDLSGVIRSTLEPQNGRARPGYWMLSDLVCVIGQKNPFLFHLVRWLTLVGTIYFLDLILFRLLVSPPFRFIAAMIFVFDPGNFENYYRLGPVEPFIALLTSALFYFLFVRKKWNFLLLSSLIFLLCLIKETFFVSFVAFFAAGLYPIFFHRKLIKKFLVFGVICLLCGLIPIAIIKSYGHAMLSGYAQNYSLSLPQIFSNLRWVLDYFSGRGFPLFLLLAMSIVFYFWLVVKRKTKDLGGDNLTVIIFLVVFVLAQIAILLPWGFVLGRYLLPTNVGFYLLYGLLMRWGELAIRRLPKYKRFAVFFEPRSLVLTIVTVGLGIYLLLNLVDDANYQAFSIMDSGMSYATIAAINNYVPKNTAVFVNYKDNLNNFEIFEAATWHLRQLYKRNDVSFFYLNDSNACTSDGRYVFDRRSDRYFDSDLLKNENFLLISGGTYYYKPMNPAIVMSSFLAGGKLPGWEDIYPFDWSLYFQKPNTCI